MVGGFYCTIGLLGALLNLGKPGEAVYYLGICLVLFRVFIMTNAIVHEGGLRIMGLLWYSSLPWDEIEGIKMHVSTIVLRVNGKKKRFMNTAIGDDDDMARFTRAIRRFAPDLKIKLVDMEEELARRTKVDAVAAILIVMTLLACVVAVPPMLNNMHASRLPMYTGLGMLLGAFVACGMSKKPKVQRKASLIALLVSGASLAYYLSL